MGEELGHAGGDAIAARAREHGRPVARPRRPRRVAMMPTMARPRDQAAPIFAAACVAAALLCTPAPAAAQSPTDFYAGKSINVLIGFSPGGGYDLYARTLARHMGRHIPGNPRLVPQNMPGAGSLRAANYLYGVAPKDGTAIAHFAPGVLFEPLLGRGGAEAGQFDATKFTWLGSVSREVSVC